MSDECQHENAEEWEEGPYTNNNGDVYYIHHFDCGDCGMSLSYAVNA